MQAFLNSAAGIQKIKSAIEDDVQREVLSLENVVVQEQGELPFSFGVSNGAIEYTIAGGAVSAKCEIEFDHNAAKRAAFWSGGKWPEADLLILFNNGWSFASDRPPWGTWHGRRTVAATSGPRQGKGFVRKAVNNYLSSAPSGVAVEIDGTYT